MMSAPFSLAWRRVVVSAQASNGSRIWKKCVRVCTQSGSGFRLRLISKHGATGSDSAPLLLGKLADNSQLQKF